MSTETPAAAPSINEMTLPELKQFAKANNIKVPSIGAKKEDVLATILAAVGQSNPTADPPSETPQTSAGSMPLEMSMDDFEEYMTRPEAAMPVALSEDQHKWLDDMQADLSAFEHGEDGVWRRPITDEDNDGEDDGPKADVPDTKSVIVPDPESTTKELLNALLSQESPLVEGEIDPFLQKEGSFPMHPMTPLDCPLEAFIERITQGQLPTPHALSDEQRLWLQGNTVFDITAWKQDEDGVWRRPITDEEPVPVFDEDDVDYDLTEAKVATAMAGWFVTTPYTGVVKTHPAMAVATLASVRA